MALSSRKGTTLLDFKHENRRGMLSMECILVPRGKILLEFKHGNRRGILTGEWNWFPEREKLYYNSNTEIGEEY